MYCKRIELSFPLTKNKYDCLIHFYLTTVTKSLYQKAVPHSHYIHLGIFHVGNCSLL